MNRMVHAINILIDISEKWVRHPDFKSGRLPMQ